MPHSARLDPVYPSKKSEMEWVVRRSGSGEPSAADEGCVRLRGLPYSCSKEEIANFFSGGPRSNRLPCRDSGHASAPVDTSQMTGHKLGLILSDMVKD